MIRGGNMMIVLKLFGYAVLAYIIVWFLQYIWGMIGFVVLLKASEYNENFFVKVLNLDNKEETKLLLLKWPLVLYRMKRNKRP